MEGIFYRNKVNDEIESPLTTLCLDNLPNFIGFIYKVSFYIFKYLGDEFHLHTHKNTTFNI
uniref:Uncharacterized protein n=1 Tax=Manihot esculenta TaxID=3983 RepID=A0A2C9WG84_MANES